MPGKHAPESPGSFYLSVARAVLGALAVLGAIVLIVVLVVSRGGDDNGTIAQPSTSRTATTRPSVSPTATAVPTVVTSPTPSTRPRSKVTIAVLNGTGRAGLAGRVRDELEKAGYKVLSIGNAPSTSKTTIYFKRNAEADADALLERYPELGRTRPANSSSDDDALITIILGSDYP